MDRNSKFFVLFLFATLAACGSSRYLASASPERVPSAIQVAAEIYEPAGFISHRDYLAMNLPFEPVREVLLQLERSGLRLNNRGEAHITVITPPEFAKLASELAMVDIERIAALIQKARFRVICLGRGTKGQDQTFFLVVESDDLKQIRRKIAAEFKTRGGAPTDFDPDRFYPHVTVGFKKRDLHEADGVIKDHRSCVSSLASK